jgi:hypothetical protein
MTPTPPRRAAHVLGCGNVFGEMKLTVSSVLVALAIAASVYTGNLISTIVQPGHTPGRSENLTQASIYRAQVLQQLAQGGVVVVALLASAAILRSKD